MEPLRLIAPLPLSAALSPGGLAAELWAKSTNCPAEAAEAQTPNTPMLSIPWPQSPCYVNTNPKPAKTHLELL